MSRSFSLRRRLFAPILLLLASPAQAADLSLTVGPAVYRLARLGGTFAAALRLAVPLHPWIQLEPGLSVSFPEHGDGGPLTRDVLYSPELGLKVTYPRAGWSPYFSAAVGPAAYDEPNAKPDWTVSVSGALGAQIPISDRLSIRTDLRFRQFSRNFGPFVVEWGTGLAFRL